MLALALMLGTHVDAPVAAAGAATTTWDTVNSNANYSYSSGNLTATRTGSSGDAIVKAVLGKTTAGSFQATITQVGSHQTVGFVKASTVVTDFVGDSGTIGYETNGTIQYNGGAVQSGLPTSTTGDVIKAAYDGAGNVQFYKNGSAIGTAVNVSAVMTGLLYPACDGILAGDAFAADFTSWG